MKQERDRKKRGHDVSVSGDPAEEVLDDLVAQFSDPYAFVRELIQNSLDAGAARIEVRMRYREGELYVETVDDGEGMDRATIEGYLLTLFRSTKEDDLTKIGKFGIGFVSLFALGPRRVVVDTGRDGVWHQVIFAKDRSYTLLEMPDPFEGTTVRLELPRDAAQAQQDCERIRESAVRWCGFAEAEITTSARGIRAGWEETRIARPFTVDAPVMIRHEADGFCAVLGPSREPAVGFYCQGLTLWEQKQALIEGVSFRVKGRHLEHTLTRDNVIRDAHFAAVMRQLEGLAARELGAAVHEALGEASVARTREIFSAISHHHPWTWREDAPLFPRVSGARATLAELRRAAPGWLRSLWNASKHELLWAPPGDEVGRAVEAKGQLVLAAASEHDAHLKFAAELVGASVISVRQRFWSPGRPPAEPLRDQQFSGANELAQKLGLPYVLHPARVSEEPLVMSSRLTVRQREPFQLEQRRPDGLEEGHHLMVDVSHPVYRAFAGLSPPLAAPLLLRAALVDAGLQPGPVPEALLGALRS
jgi:hypothetical protein